MNHPASRTLATRLLEYGAINQHHAEGAGSSQSAVQTLFVKLKATIVPLMGPGGYIALLSRALAKAQIEAPALAGLKLSQEEGDGLKLFYERVDALDQAKAEEAATALLAEFIDLLAGMLTVELAIRIVSAAWPGVTIEQGPSPPAGP